MTARVRGPEPGRSPASRGVVALLALLGLAGCSPSAPGPEPPSPAPPGPEEGGSAALEEGVDFRVYRSDGTPAALADVVAALDTVEVLFVGEEHDDAVGHRVQLRLLSRAFAFRVEEGRPPPVLSLEMFESDVQPILDEYLAGLITEEHFLDDARPWDRYDRHYRPLVEFARVHGLPVVAANAPRRYVNRASRLGRESLEALPQRARAHLPPLPYPEPSEAYREEWDALMGDAAGHGGASLLDAQSLWDATMAWSVARSLERSPRAGVVHLAGGFHVQRGTGIPEALEIYRPGTRWSVVAMRSVEDPAHFDLDLHRGLGDFVILTADR